MVVRVAGFAGEYAALAAWTGQSEAAVRAGEHYHGGSHLVAWDGDRIVGVAHRWHDRDGRQRLLFRKCRAGTHGPLARAVDGACTVSVETRDAAALAGLGFAETGRWREYTIPVVGEPASATPQIGGRELRIVGADRVGLERLARLDADLRDRDVDLEWFRRETVDSPYFDPLTYRVALDGERAVGMARVWLGPRPRPHLGAVGVLPAHRRRGIGRALLRAAVAPLGERGVPVVTAAADTTDTASAALFTAAGAEVAATWIDMHRPA